MAKKTLDNINKAPETPKETKLKSRTKQTTNFLASFKPKPRFKRTPIEDSDPTNLSSKRIDLIQLSITIVLAIIALWSAYFVTRLLSSDSNPFDSISKTINLAKDKVSNNSKSTETNKATLSDNNSENTDNPNKTNNNVNPFAPASTTNSESDTPAQKPAATTPPTISKSSFNIRILNGNGITGDANKFKRLLTDQGFKVGTVGNARLKYNKTQVYYIPGQEDQANLVKDSLSDRQVELSQQGQDLVGRGYQVLVVLGRS